jgi:porin
MIMSRVAFHIFATLGCLLSLGSAALAQEAPLVGPYSISPLDRQQFGEFDPFAPLPDRPVSDFGRSLLSRQYLTGDFFGWRAQLAGDGITLDVDETQFFQVVAAGGLEQAAKYGGKIDYYVKHEANKSGPWEGFSASMHAETRYGQDVNAIDGMLTFGNFNMAFPKAGETVTAITAVNFSQSLSDNFTVFAAKINSLDDFELNFTGHNGIDRFMNSAAVANIINARTVPYSTYGTGFTVFRDKEPLFIFVVRDPDNHATTCDLGEVFAHGVLLSGTLKILVTPWGLIGHQNLGFNWSSRDYTSVDPASYINVPGQGIVAPLVSGSWAVWYNFDQYLWVSPSNPDVGWGVFGMTGISDGNPNPIRWNLTLGLGGNSLIQGRERDTFGAACFCVGLSSDFKSLLSSPLAPPGLAQQDEVGVELFYNASLTPWCYLTGDLQIVSPSTINVDTTVLAGLRLKMSF